MENHFYQWKFDILLSDISEPEKLPILQGYKARIVRLHEKWMEEFMLDNNAKEKMVG